MDPRITYFPVGNGDCSLITLSDNTQIVIDCNTTAEASDENDASRYDVHAHLLQFGKRLDGKIPHVDVFILTHADQDHCRGFDTMADMSRKTSS
jgi:Cft2 family RNA processing exonuclease